MELARSEPYATFWVAKINLESRVRSNEFRDSPLSLVSRMPQASKEWLKAVSSRPNMRKGGPWSPLAAIRRESTEARSGTAAAASSLRVGKLAVVARAQAECRLRALFGAPQNAKESQIQVGQT